ncbi:MAG: RNA polymerase sigma factor (sigma-70 family) [Saprospiraceae bacterium]|jgi:RNA polymerase sigma factor (sigma-70 family)
MNKENVNENLTLSEKDLFEGCLKGESNCQKALYEQYKVSLFRVCLRYAKDRMEAEDMLQDGFIKIFSDLHQFSFQGPLGGWMRKVVVNVALQHIRKNKKFQHSVELEHISNEHQTDEMATTNLNTQALTKLIQNLPVGYRTVFNLYVIDGYSHKEIGEMLNININTSKSQLSKAKASLRNILQRREVRSE